MLWSEIGLGFGQPGGTPLPRNPKTTAVPPPPRRGAETEVGVPTESEVISLVVYYPWSSMFITMVFESALGFPSMLRITFRVLMRKRNQKTGGFCMNWPQDGAFLSV